DTEWEPSVDLDEGQGSPDIDFSSFGETEAWEKASEWAEEWLKTANALGLIPDCLIGADMTKQINRREFASVAVKVYEALAGVKTEPIANNPFADCDDVEVLKAYNVGITDGTGEGEFSPENGLTRQEAATMLTRVYKKYAIENWTLKTDKEFDGVFKAMFEKPEDFADDADIDDWAKDSVYFMKAKSIINGVGDNKFAPKHGVAAEEAENYGLATREEALKIAVGMVNNLK
ncbi:MAG: S-layer homology domain-containing protein, partial [Clostridia bacterium]|nr:S-layer homology domain-containing protein [Clostridia bacterium]